MSRMSRLMSAYLNHERLSAKLSRYLGALIRRDTSSSYTLTTRSQQVRRSQRPARRASLCSARFETTGHSATGGCVIYNLVWKRRALIQANTLIAISSAIARDLHGRGPGLDTTRAEVFPNMVDIATTCDRDDPASDWGAVRGVRRQADREQRDQSSARRTRARETGLAGGCHR